MHLLEAVCPLQQLPQLLPLLLGLWQNLDCQ
jgi:hypothetical protein